MPEKSRIVKIVKKGDDESNLTYWMTLSYSERMIELEKMREEIIKRFYGDQQGFQRILRITQRT